MELDCSERCDQRALTPLQMIAAARLSSRIERAAKNCALGAACCMEQHDCVSHKHKSRAIAIQRWQVLQSCKTSFTWSEKQKSVRTRVYANNNMAKM